MEPTMISLAWNIALILAVVLALELWWRRRHGWQDRQFVSVLRSVEQTELDLIADTWNNSDDLVPSLALYGPARRVRMRKIGVAAFGFILMLLWGSLIPAAAQEGDVLLIPDVVVEADVPMVAPMEEPIPPVEDLVVSDVKEETAEIGEMEDARTSSMEPEIVAEVAEVPAVDVPTDAVAMTPEVLSAPVASETIVPVLDTIDATFDDVDRAADALDTAMGTGSVVGILSAAIFLLLTLFRFPAFRSILYDRILKRWYAMIPMVLGLVSGLLYQVVSGVPLWHALLTGLLGGGGAVALHEWIVESGAGKNASRSKS